MATNALLPEGWTWPTALLASLTLALVVALVVAASTSTAAFGAFNPAWDGASDLQALADDSDVEADVILNTSAYESTDPNATVAIVLSPDVAYSAADRGRLKSFVRRGGTLVIAEDFGPHGDDILASLGAESRFDGRTLYDERNFYRGPALPVATNVSGHSLTRGVNSLTLNHGTVVRVPNATAANETTGDGNVTVVVRSSEFSYLDEDDDDELGENETLERRPVAVVEPVGAGRVVVVSDPSLFINAMLDRPGNRRFVRNLFAAHEHVLLDYSHLSGQPPLSVALLTLRGSGVWQVLLGLAGLAAVVVWRHRPDALARVRRRLSRAETPDRAVGGATAKEMADYLRRRHPDWEERRVRRVIRGVLARRDEATDDD